MVGSRERGIHRWGSITVGLWVAAQLSVAQKIESFACVFVATKHNNPQVKLVVFESRSLVPWIVQVFWLFERRPDPFVSPTMSYFEFLM
jgi:hypothetical protein